MSSFLKTPKNAVKWLYMKTNRDRLALSKAHGFLVLCYHSIPKSGNSFYETPIDDFERHVIYLKERFHIIKAKDAFELDESSLEDNLLLAFTFDDGYEDNYTNVLPILKRYNVPATFFVSSGNLDGTTNRVVESSMDPAKRMMSWSQVQQMSKNPLVDIGSHGCRHINMTTLTRNEFMIELSESRRQIQAHTGKACTLFAYPGGFHNEETKDLLEEEGFMGAFTSEQCVNRIPIDKYAISRVAVTRNHRAVANLAYFLAHVLSIPQE